MKLKLNKELALVVILAGVAYGCSGPEGGSNESDKRTINGKVVGADGVGGASPGQARRAAAHPGP